MTTGRREIMPSMELKITGMTCKHCVMAVTKALNSVAGVTAADVCLENGRAVVSGTAEPDTLIRAIEHEGYHALQQP
jgi:copper chaperone